MGEGGEFDDAASPRRGAVADSLMDVEGFSPWERWAWGRIAQGRAADMANFKAEGGAFWDETALDRERDPVVDPINYAEAWPAWQTLSERFLRWVLFSEPSIAAMARPRCDIQSAFISDRLVWEGRRFPVTTQFAECRFAQTVVLRDARAARTVAFEKCRFDGGVNCQQIRIEGAFLLRDSLMNGDIDMIGARIGGWTALNNTRLRGRLRADGVHIEGSLQLKKMDIDPHDEGATAVRLDGARIDGYLNFSDAKVRGKLLAERLRVEADLEGQGAWLFGGASFIGARISGLVNLDRATLDKPVRAIGVDVAGSVFFLAAQRVCDVDLTRARIGGNLQLASARIEGALNLSGAEIAGALVLEEKTDDPSEEKAKNSPPDWGPGARINFRNASLGALEGSITAWETKESAGGPRRKRAAKGRFVRRELSGLSYRRVGDIAEAEPKDLIAWIEDRRPARVYAPGPYATLANALSQAGYESRARRVRQALGAHDERAEKRRFVRLVKWLSGRTIGYGYDLPRGFYAFLILVLAYTAIGIFGFSPESASQSPETWFNWFSYSIANAMPGIHDQTALSRLKEVNSNQIAFQVVFGVQTATGLAILTFPTPGLTGMARRRASE